jgi:flagellar biosynthesis/type III secretory pathway protein FliH
MTNNKQQTAVEWLVEKINEQKAWANPQQLKPLIDQAKEKDKEQQEKLSASWAKSREQTRETAMHVGFAKGFMSGLECYEDYYSELENTDLDEDEFTRNYITDRFEERY